MSEFNTPQLASIAWAFTVANVYAGGLFGPAFACCCEAAFAGGSMQLYQWMCWHRELALAMPLSPALCERCAAMVGRLGPVSPSCMQVEVLYALAELCESRPAHELETEAGHQVDAVVLWKGSWVAVEVDGPSHYLKGEWGGASREMTGPTKLRNRQLEALGWRVVVVPYWEWDQNKNSQAERHAYLSHKLNMNG